MIQIDLCSDPGVPDDVKNLILFVTDYRRGSYDSDGEALGLTAEGEVFSWNLGHCSCYGPLDRKGSNEGSLEDFRNLDAVGFGNVALEKAFLDACDKL